MLLEVKSDVKSLVDLCKDYWQRNDQDLFTWLVKREQWDTCAHLPMVQTLLETASTRL